MAVSDPTANYGWLLPDVGGDIGAWGGILNSVFGEDADVFDQGGGVLGGGIDKVVGLLQAQLDTLEAEIDAIETRVTVLEDTPPTALGARTELSSSQSIPKNSATKMAWGTNVFDEGSLSTPDITRMTVPADGTGLWQVRASIKGPKTAGSAGGGDDGRFMLIQIKKNGTEIIGEARIPYFNDGIDQTNSGDVSVDVAVLDVAANVGDYYEAWLTQGFASGGGTSSLSVEAGNGSYLEAMRITKELA